MSILLWIGHKYSQIYKEKYNKGYLLIINLINLINIQAVNKGTGVVTTTRITHATPAAAYAHIAERDWEDDSMVIADGVDSNTCDDIAEQLIQNETGKKLKVVLGGGRAYFTPLGFIDPETGANIGRRRDGKNLINQWITDHPTGAYVNTRDELLRLNLTSTSSIFGI